LTTGEDVTRGMLSMAFVNHNRGIVAIMTKGSIKNRGRRHRSRSGTRKRTGTLNRHTNGAIVRNRGARNHFPFADPYNHKGSVAKIKKGNRERIGIAATKKTDAAPNNGRDIKTKHGTVAAARGTATVDDERGGGITLTRVVIQSLLMDVFFGDELPTASSNVDFRAGVTVPGTAGRRGIVSIEIVS